MSRLRSLLIVFVSLMELSWFCPWLVFLSRALTGRDRVLMPALVFFLYFFVQGVGGLLDRWRIADRYQRIVVGALVLLTALLTIRLQVYAGQPFWSLRWLGSSLSNLVRLDPAMSRELFLVLATLAIWWRGLGMSRGALYAEDVGFQFRLGVILLVVLIVLQSILHRPAAIGWVLSLFLCGLVAMALTRIRDGTPTRRDAARFSLRWLFLLLLSAGGTLLLGLGVSTLFSADAFIWQWLEPVLKVVGIVVLYVIFAVSYVLIWLLSTLFKLFPLPEPQELETITMSPVGWLGELLESQSQSAAQPVWLEWVQRGVVILVVATLFALLLLIVRRWQSRSLEGPDTWRESVWSSREVGQGLLRGLRNGLRNLAGLWAGRGARRAYSAATVRRIYASLLALAEKCGVLRPPAETPFEYLPRLQNAFPGWDAELRVITGAYVDAHYGRVPDTEAELQALRDTWQRLQTWAESRPENEIIN